MRESNPARFQTFSPERVARFWRRVNRTDACWLWTGGTNGRGYGQLKIDGQQFYAHRLAFEVERGPIPNGLVIDHLCRTPLCVNPDHLEPVTNTENLRRGVRGGDPLTRERCKNDHPWDDVYRAPNGTYHCRHCRREAQMRSDARRTSGRTG
jgi:HNH endonuclease